MTNNPSITHRTVESLRDYVSTCPNPVYSDKAVQNLLDMMDRLITERDAAAWIVEAHDAEWNRRVKETESGRD